MCNIPIPKKDHASSTPKGLHAHDCVWITFTLLNDNITYEDNFYVYIYFGHMLCGYHSCIANDNVTAILSQYTLCDT